MPKSMKTAFIRVSALNNTQNGIVKYSADDIGRILNEWSSNCKMKFWWAEHEPDADDSNDHFHITIQFSSPMPFDNVKKHFPYGDIETAKNIKRCVQYLVHFNDPSKKQYDWGIVKTNTIIPDGYKMKSNYIGESMVDMYLDQIQKGEIREYNLYEKVPIDIYSKYKNRLENGLEWYKGMKTMDKNREIEVVFISGNTGLGKTTFAKEYCQKMNKSYCVSSTSNDPMQDYKGEDVLILDDLRDTEFSFTDLLKILDNHTKTTVKSRYKNKAFIGDTIMITSYKPLCEWYFNVDADAKKQLYRRIKTQFQFTDDDKIKLFAYNEKLMHYEYVCTTPNIYKLSGKKASKIGMDILSAMGLEMNVELENQVATQIEMNWDRICSDTFDEIVCDTPKRKAKK